MSTSRFVGVRKHYKNPAKHIGLLQSIHHQCSCSKPWPGFPTPCVVVFCMFNGVGWYWWNCWPSLTFLLIIYEVCVIIPSATKLRRDIVTLPSILPWFRPSILVNTLGSTSCNGFWPNLVHI